MHRKLAFTLAGLALAASPAFTAPIFVPGPSPVAPFGGTLIDFEGLAEGTLIDTEFAGLGVTFTQDDGGTPRIDNLPPEFGFGPGSGVGVLTGSMTGGAPFNTIAGIVAEFTSPVARAGAFFSDTSPLGDYTITAYDTLGGVLETYTLTAASLGLFGCDLFPDETGCGVFVGFDMGSAVIGSIQFGRSSSSSADSFSIDDFRFEGGAAVPEPSTLALFGVGLVALGVRRRR